jgi:hypothetical protein
MHTLSRLNKMRSHVAIGHENARLAAYEALMAGSMSNVAALGLLHRRNLHDASKKAARARAQRSTPAGMPGKRFATLVTQYRAIIQSTATARWQRTSVPKWNGRSTP